MGDESVAAMREVATVSDSPSDFSDAATAVSAVVASPSATFCACMIVACVGVNRSSACPSPSTPDPLDPHAQRRLNETDSDESGAAADAAAAAAWVSVAEDAAGVVIECAVLIVEWERGGGERC